MTNTAIAALSLFTFLIGLIGGWLIGFDTGKRLAKNLYTLKELRLAIYHASKPKLVYRNKSDKNPIKRLLTTKEVINTINKHKKP